MATVNNIRLLGDDCTKTKEISSSSYKGKKPWLEKKEKPKKDAGKKRILPCIHCKKSTHLERYCWYRPDIQCRSCKQFAHIEKVCKNKGRAQASSKIKLRLLGIYKLKRSMFLLHPILQPQARSEGT
ncbi:hypothetical protein J1N35_008480, partial [Gossypium stocksii]